MHRGITPTITLTLPEGIDLGYANNVYVSISDRRGKNKITLTGAALTIDGNTITTTLRQEDTLKLSQAYIQVNWTYLDGGITKRASSEIVSVYFKDTLEPEVLA